MNLILKKLFSKMEVILLSSSSKAPERQTEYSAGYDIYADEANIISQGYRKLISTGFKISIPEGYYGRVAPRSSLACKQNVDVGAGVIDSDYRGEVKVLLINNGHTNFIIEKGDRIAQLIIEKIITPEIKIVEELKNTSRGENGFGSTGK